MVRRPHALPKPWIPSDSQQSDVGQLPADWEYVRLGDIADLLTGFPFPSARFANSGIKLVRGSNVKRGALDWRPDITEYWPVLTPALSGYELRSGDVVIAMDGALVGRSYAVISEKDEPALLVQRVARIRSRRGDSGLLPFLIGSDSFPSYVDAVKTHSAIPHISAADIREFPVAVPSDAVEQSVIASALGAVDALIDVLDKLITKKRAIKLGAMQQLLTGKTRLPGFTGPWARKKFGDLFAFLATATNPRSDLSNSGDVDYIHYGDIHAAASSFLDCSKQSLPRIQNDKVANIQRVEEGDLVMVDASEDYEGIGKCVEIRGLGSRPVVAGLHTFLLRGDRSLLADGFKAYLWSIPSVKRALVRLATGISVYGISKNNVRRIEVLLPSVPEQRAIASLLGTFDAEIEALTLRRDKTKAMKVGMMQVLLTGRVRLKEVRANA